MAVYNNVRTLVTFFLAYKADIDHDWLEEFMCSRTVKLNGQGETFAHVLAMGHHWRYTHRYTFIDVQ